MSWRFKNILWIIHIRKLSLSPDLSPVKFVLCLGGIKVHNEPCFLLRRRLLLVFCSARSNFCHFKSFFVPFYERFPSETCFLRCNTSGRHWGVKICINGSSYVPAKTTSVRYHHVLFNMEILGEIKKSWQPKFCKRILDRLLYF